jgi:hypothetical protein
MAKPPAPSVPARPAPSSPGDAPQGPVVRGAEAVARGVRRQRRHIQDLTGEDPLRGGIAD